MLATLLVRRVWSVRVLVVLLATALVSTAVASVPALRSPARAVTPPAADQGPAERPDLVSAQLTARAQKRRIEVTGLRTESTTAYVNPDGTMTVDSYSGIRRVRAGDGWADVDTTLVVADGKVTPKVTKAGIVLSAGSQSAGDVATLIDGDRTVAFGWASALPAPVLKDNTATYKGVAADTDLVVTVTATGYDLQIVAYTPAAAQAALRVPMRLHGVTASRTPGGETQLSAGGKVTARSPAPLMWDAHVDPTSRQPTATRTVDATLDTAKADAPTLTLKPDKTWLTDKARQYPVTIDPAATLADNLDTDVNSANPTTNYDTYSQLRLGNLNGNSVNRSFLRFDDSAIKGKHVTSAVLNLWQGGSQTCTVEPMVVEGSGLMGPGTTWNSQPTADGVVWGSGTFNNGGSCTGSGGTNIDITGLVSAWSSNGFASPEALTMRASNESDTNQFKWFYSGDTILAPHISVTYNSYPATVSGRSTAPCLAPCAVSPSPVLTNTTTPTLYGGSYDPDGTAVRVDFEVWNANATTDIANGSVSNIAANSTGAWTVPSGLLANGGSYEWRARGFDGTDYSKAWSTWIPFAVDTTAPAAPSAVSSTVWPSGGWGSATSGTFTWTSPGGDTKSFLYGLDQPSPSTETTSTTTATLGPTPGLHKFYVRTKDTSGNLSSVVSYSFGVGTGALAQPDEGARIQRYTTLEGQAPSSQVSVRYQYHWGSNTSTTWVDIPTSDVVIAGTSTHPTAWPVARNGSALFDKLTWDLGTTMANYSVPDGADQIRACFTDSSSTVSCTPARTVQYSRRAFADADATAPVGPGTVALLTGDFAVSATDVSMPTYTGSLTVGRTDTTLSSAGGLVVDPSSPAAVGWAGNGCTAAGNAVTASFTAPANALLLAFGDTASNASGASNGPSLSDSGGLTWTQIGSSGASATKDEAVAWWAKTTGSSARTVTLHASNNVCTKFLKVIVLTGANLINPIAATNIGPATTAEGVLNQSVTSTTAGSMAFAAVADWNAAGTPTPGTGVTLAGSYSQFDATGAALYRTAPSTTFGQTMTISTTAPTTATNSWVMFEVRPAVAATTPAATGVFGPGWTASMPGPDAGRADESLADFTDSQGYVTLTDETGVQDVYLRSGTGAYPYAYTGVGDSGSDGSKLVKNSATQFTATDDDGTQTVYQAVTVNGATTWPVASVVEPGSGTTSSFTTDSAGRTTRILAPVPAGITCITLVAGCRALTLTYASSTTATGTTQATWGDYVGRLTAIAMSLNGNPAVTVAQYAYDSNGLLRSAKDPRTGLATTYGYDSLNRLTTVTPPGQATWTMAYDGSGRLLTASRPTPVGATATQTVAYDIPVTGTGAPIDLSSGQAANWAQTDLPIYGAGVFAADHVPASPPTATDWPYASLTYLDTDGRAVNAASYGNNAWQISTTEHDANGNVVRSLSAENRDQALSPTADTDPSVAALTTSAARSQLVDDQTVYSSDGVLVTDTYGPTHPIIDNSGGRYSAREHVHTDYDQGAPSAPDPYRLPTTVTTTARTLTGTDVDPRKTVNGYEAKTGADPSTSGWTLRKPTTVTTWMGGGTTPDIVKTTYYNAAGNVVESRQPKANNTGTDAYTTLTTYYTATGTGSCVNASWTGLACTSGPAAQPSTGNPLPVTTNTYNDLAEPLTSTDSVTVSGTTTTRTTTDTYDSAGRKTSEAIAASPAANGGTALPTATYGFDPATGLATTTTASGITLTTGYDSWGRVTSQTDADGNSASSSYDIDGRVATSSDGKGTYTYTYDGVAGEHRGLVTSLNVGAGSAPSTFSATYNGDGSMTTETYPSGLVAKTRYDNSGDANALTYTMGTTPWMTFAQANSIYGQVRLDSTPQGGRTLGYDPSGRLASVADTASFGSGTALCSTRVYAYDAESNRASLTSYPDAGGSDTGTCSTSTSPTGFGFGYDQADRLTNSGYTYDLFGRTTTDPYPPNGTSATIGYYVNDQVASETVGSTTRTYATDPARRIRSWTDGSSTSINHYTSSSGDDPAWIGTGTAWTRNIVGIDGSLAASQDNAGTVTLQLANLHGDIVATVADSTSATSLASYADNTEFGLPYFTSAAYPTYGWLGGKQRSRNTLSGLTLMGVRLYDPDLGRFLQTDPVPGGSANAYDYCNADPINCTDVDGQWPHLRKMWKKLQKAGLNLANNKLITLCTNFAPGQLGMACGLTQVIGYSLNGQFRNAAGVGLGMAVGAGVGAAIDRYGMAVLARRVVRPRSVRAPRLSRVERFAVAAYRRTKGRPWSYPKYVAGVSSANTTATYVSGSRASWDPYW